jgi:glycosyltransferase involved in cell wall biosynthesis
VPGKMKILIDGQTLSTPDIHRGIGNVFLEIVGNLVKLGRHHEFFLAVYDDYAKDQIEGIRNEIQIVRLGKKIDTGERCGEEYTNNIIHLISGNAIDCFLIPNPVMPNVNLIKKPLKCKVLITFYDLIPLIFEEFYLNNWQDNVKQEYLTRLRSLNEIADCILPISTSTKNDLIRLLKIPPDKIRTVYPGLKKWNYATNEDLSDSTGEKFILYVGGFDPRKNMMRNIITRT